MTSSSLIKSIIALEEKRLNITGDSAGVQVGIHFNTDELSWTVWCQRQDESLYDYLLDESFASTVGDNENLKIFGEPINSWHIIRGQKELIHALKKLYQKVLDGA